ncbi:DUF2798 domain-containing protein [Salipiger mangrovisoli]|nr:DUF2798 domain-containing protein [Salipiger mangrovisoli]
MTPSRPALLLAQLFISGSMSFLMTGIFAAVPLGFAPGWGAIWMQHWLTAWPIAFVLSLVVGPLCFKATFLVLRGAARLR